MVRNLKEFRIRGIKTNIPFLENVVKHDKFLTDAYDTHLLTQRLNFLFSRSEKTAELKCLHTLGMLR